MAKRRKVTYKVDGKSTFIKHKLIYKKCSWCNGLLHDDIIMCFNLPFCSKKCLDERKAKGKVKRWKRCPFTQSW